MKLQVEPQHRGIKTYLEGKKNKKESTAQDIETFPRNKKRMTYVLNAKRDSES